MTRSDCGCTYRKTPEAMQFYSGIWWVHCQWWMAEKFIFSKKWNVITERWCSNWIVSCWAQMKKFFHKNCLESKKPIFVYRLVWIGFVLNPSRKITYINKLIVKNGFVHLYIYFPFWVELSWFFFSITQNWISRIVFSFRFALIMISWNEYWVYKACIKFDEKWMSHFVVSFMKKYIKN